MWDVNDSAVCVDGQFDEAIARLYTALPQEGRTYRVRDVLIGFRHGDGGRQPTVRLLLVGLVNPRAGESATTERGFDERRFRKPDELVAGQPEIEAEEIADRDLVVV